MRRFIAAAGAFGLSLPALAQENVLLRAQDAFGERVGVEQVGLYGEGQVRGFSIGNTGAYRINGIYFVRAGGQPLPDAVLNGVTVKVGIAAAREGYPSPSGVVDYRLQAPNGNSLTVTTGLRERATPFVETRFSRAGKDGRFGIVGGSLAADRDYGDGTGGSLYNIGLVPLWRPSDKLNVQGLFSAERSRFNGYYSVSSTVNAPPPLLRRGINYGAPWADYLRMTYNAGMIAIAEPAPGWDAHAAVFYADNTVSPSDFTALSVSPDRSATAVFVRNTEAWDASLSAEGMLRYSFGAGGAQHALNAAARARRTRVSTLAAPAAIVGLRDLDQRAYPPEPAFPAPAAGSHDNVDLVVGSLGYAGLFFNRLELRAGLHHSRYEKNVVRPALPGTSRVEDSWAYNVSLVYAMTPKLSAFANTVKGIEESGVAPGNAVNHDEVLPPVQAREYELGFRYGLTPRLSLTAALFDTTKRTPGFRPDGIYTLVGNVNHRGIEASVSGRVVEGTIVVMGIMAMRPRLSGEAVDSGLIGRKPAGIPATLALASIDQDLGFAPGWSVDARATWTGGVTANVLNTFGTPGTFALALGTRYRFELWGTPTLFRAVISNLGARDGWTAGAGNQFSRTQPVTWRATVTATF